MAGRHLRNRSIALVEDNIGGRDSNEFEEISSLDNTAINQEAETVGSVMSECEANNSDGVVSTEVGVDMSIRQMHDLLTSAISTLRSDFLTITEQFDSKLHRATENITAKIEQKIEKLSEKLTQNLHNEIKKLSSDVCTLRNDTESKFQEVTKTVGSISDATNERIDAHVVATRKMTDSISQEMNASSGRLLNDMREYRTETENSLKEFRQDYSLFREKMNSEQATWQ